MGLFRKRSTAAIMEVFHDIAAELSSHAEFSRERVAYHQACAAEHYADAGRHLDEAIAAEKAAAKIRELVS